MPISGDVSRVADFPPGIESELLPHEDSDF
jgi:hypothetical protein